MAKGEFVNGGSWWDAKEVVHLNPVLLREHLTTHILKNRHHCVVFLQLTDEAHSDWCSFSRVAKLVVWSSLQLLKRIIEEFSLYGWYK